VAQGELTSESMIHERLAGHMGMMERLAVVLPAVAKVSDIIAAAIMSGGKLLLFGNGGSAADCQHLAAELVNRYLRERGGYPALALTTDTSALTAIANDSAFAEVFSRQIEALARPGDVALGISTSGNSRNVIRGLQQARAMGVATVAFTGEKGGEVGAVAEHLIQVPSMDTPRIQEAHIFLGHVVCEIVERTLAAHEFANRGGQAGAQGDESEDRQQAGPSRSEPEAAYFLHESSFADSGASIGNGTRIWHFCHIQEGARVGRGCSLGQNVNVDREVFIGDRVKIQNNVAVYKGVVVEDDVFLGPSMVFTNVLNPRSHINRKHEFLETRVGKGATIGANATIVCGHSIGRHAFVAAGAVVTTDVPAYALVMGVPAKVVGWMCECGVRLSLGASEGRAEAACTACGLQYRWDGAGVTPVETIVTL